MRLTSLVLLGAFALGSARAETPPCGVAIIRAEDGNVDERFIPATQEQVKDALLKALPALAQKVAADDNEFHITTEPDGHLRLILFRRNKDAGVRGFTAGLGPAGRFSIEVRRTTRDGVSGSLLRVEFHKLALAAALVPGNTGLAHPLADETACLVRLLSTNDPATNPRGLGSDEAGEGRTVVVADGTPLKVLLPAPLYSKALKKSDNGETVQFEVAEDVVVDGVVPVRRGALATGHFTEIRKPRRYGRHAELQFVFDAVTAADGERIPISGPGERARGGRHDDTIYTALSLPVVAGLIKGHEVFIRAGTTYDVEISGTHTLQTRRVNK
ncbi:MAG: hypothetical protein JO022_21880 [Acidobacteriaceae bacterium]|nr:hypothetical protein [Acidobacteriaceae bacterium]